MKLPRSAFACLMAKVIFHVIPLRRALQNAISPSMSSESSKERLPVQVLGNSDLKGIVVHASTNNPFAVLPQDVSAGTEDLPEQFSPFDETCIQLAREPMVLTVEGMNVATILLVATV